MNILFYDIQVTGHHSEYINHLVDYLLENDNLSNNYFFIVHQDFIFRFPNIFSKTLNKTNIKFIEVDTALLEGKDVKNRILKSLKNFSIVDKYAKELKIDICYLLHFNVFQIALGFKKTTYKVKGILFMQFTNMRIKSFRDYYYYLRRYFPILLAVRNKNLDAVFILNDENSCAKLNSKFKKNNLFKFLPDPIPQIVPEKVKSLQDYYDVKEKKLNFLHFGSLSERKGVIEIINAVKLIDKSIQDEINIIIVGRTSDVEFENKIHQNIIEAQKQSSVNIIWENTFVSERKMATLFKLCDFILMPYKNPEASSGILGHAMIAQKPIIGPSNGLIGNLIKEYNLGYGLADITDKSVAKAINNHKKIIFDPNKSKAFIEEHTTFNFSKTLLCH